MSRQNIPRGVHMPADKEFFLEFPVIIGAVLRQIYNICIFEALGEFPQQCGVPLHIEI